MTAVRAGFIGIGNMGRPMAGHVAAAGHGLTVFDTDPAAAATVAGARVAASPAAMARDCDVVITMLPDADVVRRVIVDDGLAAALPEGAVIVDMSSSAPLATRELGDHLAGLGLRLVDAPVSGGVARAVDATLTIMAGGESADVDAVEPLLSAMGKVHRTGPLGSGHAMKALNNYVSAAGLMATCEALVIAREFGLDPAVLNAVLNVSTGRNNTTERKVDRFILNGAFDSGFTLALMHKDVGMARDLAAKLGLDAPTLAACSARLGEALAQLGDNADHTEAFRYVETRLKAHD